MPAVVTGNTLGGFAMIRSSLSLEASVSGLPSVVVVADYEEHNACVRALSAPSGREVKERGME